MELDCGMGEGGGQVLRTSLSLACVLGKSVSLNNIRAKRPKPGLQPQHLACVNALQEIAGAKVEGNEIGSSSVSFSPSTVRPGDYSFDIGTAGSVALLAQCILPVLCFAEKPSTVKIRGGTHVPFAPPFDYFTDVFLATVRKMGVKAEATLKSTGFYPAGGGEVRLEVKPVRGGGLDAILVEEKGRLKKIELISTAGSLPESIAKRQADAAKKTLEGFQPKARIAEEKTLSPGTFFMAKAEYENSIAGFSSLGKRGKRAEEVGEEAASAFLEFNSSSASVDEHLADQVMLYAVLAKGESTFKSKTTGHVETNAEVIRRMTGIETTFDDNGVFAIKGLSYNPKA